jgi:hypothetical protein
VTITAVELHVGRASVSVPSSRSVSSRRGEHRNGIGVRCNQGNAQFAITRRGG